MRLIYLLPVLMGACLTAQAEMVENRVNKTFEAASGGVLTMEVDRGSVDVRTADQSQIAVEVFRKCDPRSSAKAEEIFRDHHITFDHQGNNLSIKAQSTGEAKKAERWGRGGLQVQYRLVVPRTFNLNIHTAGGGIGIADIKGDVKAQTAGGGINVGAVDGPVNVHTAGGGIDIKSATGRIDARTAGGSVKVGSAPAGAGLHSSGGGLVLGGGSGKLVLETAGGSIDLTAQNAEVVARTSGGGIKADLKAPLAGDSQIRTSAGAIDLKLDDEIAVTIHAETSAGSVHTDLPVTVKGEAGSGRLQGTINGGGPKLDLSTSAGHIAIHKR